jgi:RNA polymerase sigma factor (sigma-70 family)
MTTLSRLLTRLRRLSAPPGPASDEVLLDRFARLRDEDAFAALLARHGPMVHNTCRRVLRDANDVDDAFQATFLVLARKAGSLRRPEALGGWLYGVASRVARQARDARGASVPLTEPADPRSDPLAEVSARDLLDALEREVQRLPQAYRLPVVFCCLEGLSLEEAAGRLGCTPGSVKGRLERGRKRLQERLAGRGWSLGAALAVAGVMRQGVSPGLLAATARAGRAFAEGAAVGVSEKVLLLTQGGFQVMAMSKVRLTLVVLVVVGLAGAGAGWLGSGSGAADPGSKPRTPPATAEAGKKKEADQLADRIAVARAQLRQAEKELEVTDEALTDQVVKARQQLAELEERLRDEQATRKAGGPTAEEMHLQHRANSLREEIDSARARLPADKARQTVGPLEKQLDTVRKELDTAMKQRLLRTPTIESTIKLRKQIVRLEEEVRQLERKRSARREEAERRRLDLVERIRQLEDGAVDGTDRDLRALWRSLDAVRRELAELRREVERLRGRGK